MLKKPFVKKRVRKGKVFLAPEKWGWGKNGIKNR